MLEVCRIARGERGAVGTADRDNLSIECCYRVSARATGRSDPAECARGNFIESEDSPCEKPREHRLRGVQQCTSAFSSWKQLDAKQDFSHADGGSKY